MCDIIEPGNKLAKIVEEQHLEAMEGKALVAAFWPLFVTAETLLAEAAKISVTDATQVTQIKASRELRLKLRRVRIDGDKTRKDFKEESLRRGKAIDGIGALLASKITPMEERLEEMEKFAERKEAERKAALVETRLAILRPYGFDLSPYVNALADMSEETFAEMHRLHRTDYEAKIAAAKKAEDDRLAAEEAKRVEDARIHAENARQKAELAAQEKAAAEERRIAAEALAAEQARAAKEKADLEAKAEAERRKAAAEALAAENKAKAEREAIEAQARKEREAAEARAAEEKRKANAAIAEVERKAKAERDAIQARADAAAKIEREARETLEKRLADKAAWEAKTWAEEEAARLKAESASDADKLREMAAAIRAIPAPIMEHEANIAGVRLAMQELESLAKGLDARAANVDTPDPLPLLSPVMENGRTTLRPNRRH
jgi:hypothetical protein